MVSIFCSPSRYVQGARATLMLGDELKYLNLEAPIYILSSRSSCKIFKDMWEETLSKHSLEYHVEEFQGQCGTKEINRNIKNAKEFGAKTIIGAGGGKVLDTARAVASEMNLPIVNCPSIASSDSPCSALSVLYKEDGSFDRYNIYSKNPILVLVDTEVIAKSPARFLVAGMGDALATMFEARACVLGKKNNMRGGGPTEASFALAKLCYETLIKDGYHAIQSLNAKSVSPALERIVEANTLLSGLGFESSGLAAAHAVHNGLTEINETHSHLHGEKVAFGTLVQLVLEGQSREQIEEVLRFACEVGLPVCLSQLSIENANELIAEKIAIRTCREGESIYNEPFPVSPESVASAVLVADKIGEDWLEKSKFR